MIPLTKMKIYGKPSQFNAT